MAAVEREDRKPRNRSKKGENKCEKLKPGERKRMRANSWPDRGQTRGQQGQRPRRGTTRRNGRKGLSLEEYHVETGDKIDLFVPLVTGSHDVMDI